MGRRRPITCRCACMHPCRARRSTSSRCWLRSPSWCPWPAWPLRTGPTACCGDEAPAAGRVWCWLCAAAAAYKNIQRRPCVMQPRQQLQEHADVSQHAQSPLCAGLYIICMYACMPARLPAWIGPLLTRHATTTRVWLGSCGPPSSPSAQWSCQHRGACRPTAPIYVCMLIRPGAPVTPLPVFRGWLHAHFCHFVRAACQDSPQVPTGWPCWYRTIVMPPSHPAMALCYMSAEVLRGMPAYAERIPQGHTHRACLQACCVDAPCGRRLQKMRVGDSIHLAADIPFRSVPCEAVSGDACQCSEHASP